MCQVAFDITHLYALGMFVNRCIRTWRNFNRNTICLLSDSFLRLNQNLFVRFCHFWYLQRFTFTYSATQGYMTNVLLADNCFLSAVLKLVDCYSSWFEHIPPYKDKSSDCCSLLRLYSNTSVLRRITKCRSESKFTVLLTAPLVCILHSVISLWAQQSILFQNEQYWSVKGCDIHHVRILFSLNLAW